MQLQAFHKPRGVLGGGGQPSITRLQKNIGKVEK